MESTQRTAKYSWEELGSFMTFLSYWSYCDNSVVPFIQMIKPIVYSSWTEFSVAYSQRHSTNSKEMAISGPKFLFAPEMLNVTLYIYWEHQQQSQIWDWILTLPFSVWTWISHLRLSKSQLSVTKGTITTISQGICKDYVREDVQSVVDKSYLKYKHVIHLLKATLIAVFK